MPAAPADHAPHSQHQRQLSFAIDASSVTILPPDDPPAFHARLLHNISNARRRICLASLYIGDPACSTPVTALTDGLRSALELNPTLRTTLLLDHLRSTRTRDSALPLLRSQLKQRFPDRLELRLLRAPGILPYLLPQRWNEVVASLLHAKIYLTDDTLLISGANLAHSYFTDRVDRYLEVRDAKVVAHYASFIDALATHAYDVMPESIIAPSPHPVTQTQAFYRAAERSLHQFEHSSAVTCKNIESDTWLTPVFQTVCLRPPRSPRGPSHNATNSLIAPDDESRRTQIFLTSGYFNPTRGIERQLLEASMHPETHVHVLVGSSAANGFHGARGAAAFVPRLYDEFLRRFMRLAAAIPESFRRLKIQQYEPQISSGGGGGSYHAKGIWRCVADRSSETAVGSSNYNARSESRDIEATAIIRTSNPTLCRALAREREILWAAARRVPRKQRDRVMELVARLLRRFM